MKRVFKDADEKYTHHLKALKRKAALLVKNQVAFAIIAVTLFWIAFFLLFIDTRVGV